MKLFLAVPRQSRQPDSEFVTSPARTRQWISQLPLLNTQESLSQIHDALHATNRTELKVGQRLRLLNEYRSPLRTVRGQVESQLARGSAPLGADDLTTAGLFRDCCVEMAYGYKSIILEIARSRKRSQLDEMRLSMGRAIFFLEQTVFACALFHQTPPAGIWQEIHTIYHYARTLGMAEESIKDPVMKGRTSTTISLAYRRALLFGLSDPFHQSVPVMARVLDFLRKHVQKTVIKPYSRPRTEHCQFIVDPESDYPARPYIKHKEDKPSRDALLLDTVEMTRHAHELLKRINSAEQVDIELDTEFQDKLGVTLLREVVQSWGVTPEREEERAAGDQARVDLVSGIESAMYCLNGESAFEISSPEDAEAGPATGSTSPQAAFGRRSDPERLDCAVMDRGETGLRLSIAYERAAVGSFRVGDVVAVRERDQPWTAASIRWMRCVDDSLELGLKTFPQTTAPAGIKPVATEREVPFKPALITYIENDSQQILQVIAMAGVYRHQRNLFIDDGETLLMVRSRRLLEQSQTVEWFECELVNL